MKRTTYASKLRSIAERYGPMSQLSKTAEELSEATSAVMRYSQRPTKRFRPWDDPDGEEDEE